jgi:7-carboxy-7-deazaguanine synthase
MKLMHRVWLIALAVLLLAGVALGVVSYRQAGQRVEAEVLTTVAQYGAHYVTVTGGEPLAQKACLVLLRALCDAGYAVSLETSGALDVSGVDARVLKVVDIKTPGSREVGKNLWSNLAHLAPTDEIKFVLADEVDYQWAKQVLLEHGLSQRCAVLFSPVQDLLAPRDLAEWILRDRLPVRMQVQLHKILWGNEVGR